MSAIWGCVDLAGAGLPPELSRQMEQPYHEYKIDLFASWQKGNVLMGCGVQYITKRAERDALPVIREEEGLYFTADCFIDNRVELAEELSPGNTDIPDGELLFLAYKKWGENASARVYGCYAYAVYDSNAGTLFLSADHVSSRCLFYAREEGRVYFSTLINPVLNVMQKPPALNNEWIAGYIANTTLASVDEPDAVIYEGIKKILPAQRLRFTPDGMKADAFWSSEDVKPLTLDSDEEYGRLFRARMESSAEQATDTGYEIAVLLSSGLDSTSVAAFAATVMARKGKTLHSYTSVPVSGFENTEFRSRNADESEMVKLFCSKYPNIEPVFASFPENNVISILPGLLRKIEIPLKTVSNSVWIDGFLDMARERGCRVVLNGQSGNLTISSGDTFIYAYEMLRRLKPSAAARSLSGLASRRKIRRRRVYTAFFKSLLPGWIQRAGLRSFRQDSLIKEEFAVGAGYGKRDKRLVDNTGRHSTVTFRQQREFCFHPLQFSFIGEIETKKGLRHGVLIRDITRDIRMVELCMSMPPQCFVSPDGLDRRLVRCYLRDYFPPQLLDENARRGVQGLDWLARMAPQWDTLYPEIVRVCTSARLSAYVDAQKTRELLDSIKEPPGYSKNGEMIQVMALYSLGLFLQTGPNA